MLKCAKNAVRIGRPDYECGSVGGVHADFQNQNINLEACEECRNNIKTGLLMWKHLDSAGRI